MNRFPYPFLIALLTAALLQAGAAELGASDIPEPNCVCAYCNYPCGSVHATSCPYYYNPGSGSGGGGTEVREPSDPSNAPIFVAPVGFVGGLFMGAGWFYNEMAGKNKNDGLLASYHKYLTVKTDNDRFDAAFNFGNHIGAAPWLALSLPLYPVRLGVTAAANAASKPKETPVDPNVAVYNLIAQNYEGLGKMTDVELGKARADVDAAASNRTRMLDEHIASSPELSAVREKEGMDAARARAEKQLDAWSRACAEKQKIALTLQQSIREKDKQIKEAIDSANPVSFLADLKLTTKEMRIGKALEDKSLPQGVQDSLNRELKINKLLQNGKQAFDIGANALEIAQSYRKAAGEGKDASQWIEDREAREKVWRLQTKLLSVPLSGGAGIAAGAAESAMDVAYAATAGVLLSGRIQADTETLDRLRTAQVFHDAAADDWDRANIALEAAKERQEVIAARGEQYKKMQKENESYARALSWKFK